jgi:hypothetical protein
MEETAELERITQLIVDAMQISTDRVTAAGAVHVAALDLSTLAQGVHLARCIAVCTTDDMLARDLAELIGESPRVLIGKVGLAQPELPPEHAVFADLEKRVWTLVYAGRRERSRVAQALARRRTLE